MKVSVVAIAVLCSALTGCASHMISGGKNPGLVHQVPAGEQITPGRAELPTAKQYPLKFNRNELPKELKDALDPYFQVRGDYPTIQIRFQPAMPEMDDGFGSGQMAFKWTSVYTADVSLNDWEEKSDLLFEFSSKSTLVGSAKAPIDRTPDTLGMMNKMQAIGYNNLAADILAKVEARRPEIDKLAKRYASWKGNR